MDLAQILSRIWLLYFAFLLAAFLKSAAASLPLLKGQFKTLVRLDFVLAGFLMASFLALSGRFSWHIDLDFYGWGYVEDALAIKDIFLLKVLPRFDLSQATHIPGYSFLMFPVFLFGERLGPVSALNLAASGLTVGLLYFLSYALSKDRLAAFLAAGFLAFSQPHILFGGFEFPIPAGLLFITLEFLFFFLYLKDRRAWPGAAFLFAFFIALNLKIENVVYGLFFAGVLLRQARHDAVLRGQLKRALPAILVLGLVTLVLDIPFLLTLARYQSPLMSVSYGGFRMPFAPVYFLDHLRYAIERTGGMALWALAGLFILRRFSRDVRSIPLVVGWFLCSLLPLAYYADLKWQVLPIGLPVFVMFGYVVACALRLFIPSKKIRAALAFLLLLLNALPMVPHLSSPVSWKNIQRSFPVLPASSCVLAMETAHTTTSLPFLFPETKWIFMDPRTLEGQGCAGPGDLYYFNVVPYGLTEETPPLFIKNVEFWLNRRYVKEQEGSLKIYRLRPLPARPETRMDEKN